MADRADRGAPVGRTSLAAARRRALAPRRAFFAVTAVLAALGVKAMVRGAPDPPAPRAAGPEVVVSPAVAGFAQAFARAYLSWDATRPQARVRALRPFLGRDLDADAGLPVPLAGAQRVSWTAALEQAPVARRRFVVTVAVAVAGSADLRYLAVPVAVDRAGMAVTDYPALVGRPAAAPAVPARAGDDVRDQALLTVVRRSLGNYLAGAEDNLRADLLDGTVMTPPARPLDLEDVGDVRWSGRDSVAALVVARDRDDVAYTLRYELAVAKRDRWYVRGISPTTDSRKESP